MKHLHKYKKVNLSQNGKKYFVYSCTKPSCTHYIPINLAEGKICECNICNKPMVISKSVLFGSNGKPLVLPHCTNCKKSKVPDFSKFLDEL